MSAGGYLDILNLDTSTISRHYYTGIPTFGLSSFIIDVIAPTHCSLVAPSNGCLQGQRILDLGGEIVEDNMITASWGGWIDVPSGVTHYEIRVYPLQLSGEMLSEMPVSINTTTYTHQNLQVIFEDTNILPAEGPYAFVL
ncbi:MAG: hypothetical protein MJE68_14050, partial [Proteobacteria bacterium]|nr:hypothetical protein [Pseudomonadota bacterium]